MAISTQITTAGLSSVAATTTTLLTRIKANAHAAVKALQMARMLSTLSNMSDNQLSQIGISRSDIPQYVETLMADE